MSGNEDSFAGNSSYNSGVTETDVRTNLHGIPDSVLTTATINQAIAIAEDVVGEQSENAPNSLRRIAVLDYASYRVASRNRSLFKNRKQALDVEAEFDVDAWIAELKDDRDDALDEVDQASAAKLFTLGDHRTSHHTSGGSRSL